MIVGASEELPRGWLHSLGWVQLVLWLAARREIAFGAPNPYGSSQQFAAAPGNGQLVKPKMVSGASLCLFSSVFIIFFYFSTLSFMTDSSHSGMGQSDVVFFGVKLLRLRTAAFRRGKWCCDLGLWRDIETQHFVTGLWIIWWNGIVFTYLLILIDFWIFLGE